VKVRSTVRIAGVLVVPFLLCAPRTVRAQAAGDPAQAASPDTQTAAPASAKPAAAQQAPPPTIQTVLQQPVGVATQDTANDLSVTVGKSVVLDLARPITRIVVGLGDYAEAQAVSPTQVLVNGKTSGETTLILWDTGGGRQFFNVTVRPSTFASHDLLEGVRRQLRAELPGQEVNVTSEGSNVYLRGTVSDLSSSNRAVTISSTAGKVINLLNVKVPEAEPQILLKVRFMSVDRSKAMSLGVNIFSTGFGNTIGTLSTGQFSPPTVTAGTGTGTSGATATTTNDLNLFAFYPGLNLGATIEALQTRGLTETLAEPNILAQNGKQASFLAGGEYPFPMVQGGGAGGTSVTIAFKEYGIRLNFIPRITPRGTIHLQLSPEVSSLNFTNAVQISGFTEPAITIRRVKTEIELADRQSFAIGGLLDNEENESFQKIPFLGDIPILGKFFQSMTRSKSNTELIVVVTPEIVSPVPAGTEIAGPKYSQPFLPPNSNTPMHTPDSNTAQQPAAATMPVEQLIESMKPETPLSDSSSSYGGGGGGGGTSGGPSPQQ